MKKITIITALCLAGVAVASSTSPLVQAPNPSLATLQVALGDWTCVGHYFDVQPFTASHDVTATFHVAEDVVAGSLTGTSAPLPQWFLGRYQERTSTNGAVIGINDSFTVNAFDQTAGTRSFVDGNRGRFGGDFTLSTLTDGSLLVLFSGTYHIVAPAPVGAIDAPFTEQLTFTASGRSFTTSSQVFGLTFHEQTCTRTAATVAP